jgi:DNA-binding LacI/PurR family transcriptional regulator
MAAAADMRLHVPRDVAIIGFDDIPLAAQLRPSLSSVAQPAHALGSLAVELAQRLANGESAQAQLLPPRLVPRESTLGPGGRYSPDSLMQKPASLAGEDSSTLGR